ncbi:uncharacterized protein LOC141908319 [Tubulanus polymorphus]|uniref:uncharacterized protein LOC141908319 n=1 Tax=Tubulanus polymorphus TaxID=672921 RepID=UPI003DA5E28E
MTMRRQLLQVSIETIEEILPGLDEYLRITLAKEKLSEDAAKRRSTFADRLDGIREEPLLVETSVKTPDDGGGLVAPVSDVPPVVPPRRRGSQNVADRREPSNSQNDNSDPDDYYEPIGEPIRELLKEPIREMLKEPIRVPVDESDRELDKEPDGEPCREPMGEPITDPVVEAVTENDGKKLNSASCDQNTTRTITDKPSIPPKPPYLRTLATQLIEQYRLKHRHNPQSSQQTDKNSKIEEENIYNTIIEEKKSNYENSIEKHSEERDLVTTSAPLIVVTETDEKVDDDVEPPLLPERPKSFSNGARSKRREAEIITDDLPPPLPPRHIPPSSTPTALPKHRPNTALPPIPQEETVFAARQRQISRTNITISSRRKPLEADEEEGDYDSCDGEDEKNGMFAEAVQVKNGDEDDDDDDDEFKVYEIPEDPDDFINGRTKTPSIDEQSDDTSYEEYDENRGNTSSREDLLDPSHNLKEGQSTSSLTSTFTRFRSLRRSKTKRRKEREKDRDKDKSFDDEFSLDFLRNVLFSGELTFKGKLTWSRRFCVIAPSRMVIYKSERDSHPQFDIRLDGFDLEYIENDLKRSHVIRMSKPGYKTYLFSTETHDRAIMWIDQLTQAASAKIFFGQSPVRIIAPQNVYVEEQSPAGAMASPLSAAGATPSPLSEKRYYSSQNSLSNISQISSEGDSLREPPSPRLQKLEQRKSLSTSHMIDRSASTTLPPTNRKSRRTSSDNFQRRASHMFSSWGKKKARRLLTATNIEGAQLIKQVAADTNFYDVRVSGHVNILSSLANMSDWSKRYCRIKNGLFECFRNIADYKYEFCFPLLGCEITSAQEEMNRPLSIKIFQGDKVKAFIEPQNTIEQGKWIAILIKETGIGQPLPESSDEDDDNQSTISPKSPASMTSDEWAQRMSINSYEEQFFLKDSSTESSSTKDLDVFATTKQTDETNSGYEKTRQRRRDNNDDERDERKSGSTSPYDAVQSKKQTDDNCDDRTDGDRGDFETTPLVADGDRGDSETTPLVADGDRGDSETTPLVADGDLGDSEMTPLIADGEPCDSEMTPLVAPYAMVDIDKKRSSSVRSKSASVSSDFDIPAVDDAEDDEILDAVLEIHRQFSLENLDAVSSPMETDFPVVDGAVLESNRDSVGDDVVFDSVPSDNDKRDSVASGYQSGDDISDNNKHDQTVVENVDNLENGDDLKNGNNVEIVENVEDSQKTASSSVDKDQEGRKKDSGIDCDDSLLENRLSAGAGCVAQSDDCYQDDYEMIEDLRGLKSDQDKTPSAPPALPPRGVKPSEPSIVVKYLRSKSVDSTEKKRLPPPPVPPLPPKPSDGNIRKIEPGETNVENNNVEVNHSTDCEQQKDSESSEQTEENSGQTKDNSKITETTEQTEEDSKQMEPVRKMSFVAPIAESELSDHDYDDIDANSLDNSRHNDDTTEMKATGIIVRRDSAVNVLNVLNKDSSERTNRDQIEIDYADAEDDDTFNVDDLIGATSAVSDSNQQQQQQHSPKRKLVKKFSICSFGSVTSDILNNLDLSFDEDSSSSCDQMSLLEKSERSSFSAATTSTTTEDSDDYDPVEFPQNVGVTTEAGETRKQTVETSGSEFENEEETSEEKQQRLQKIEDVNLEIRKTKREIVQLKKLRLAAQNKKVQARDHEMMEHYASKYETLDQHVSKREKTLQKLQEDQLHLLKIAQQQNENPQPSKS